MGRPISYFANYHSKENAITNYCGLLLKMIYDSNPSKFSDVMTSILADDGVSIEVGARFSQQVKRQASIPDIAITQSSYNIFFENKTKDWFYTDQLGRHICGFNESSLNILVLLCSEFTQTDVIDQARVEARKKNILIAAITYEEFLTVLEAHVTSEFLTNQLAEFRNFLDEEELLPNWKYRLDVVNCAGRPEEVETDSVYICPDTGRSYSHKRAMYFGAYKDKKVHHIYTISAVLSVAEACGEVKVKWHNDQGISSNKLKNKAMAMVRKYREQENRTTPLQVFILDNEREVSFVKESKGGLRATKVYFETIAKDCKGIDELADRIDKRSWSEFKE